jgi:hypothetical protein
MALDHYVPQIHLSKFVSPALTGERMYAMRKSDLKRFEPNSKDVCRIESGNTNEYLRHDRAIEEFLKGVEPKYSAAVDNLTKGQIDGQTIYAIAGFVASVITCSPAAMRIGAEPLKRIVEMTAQKADELALLPPPPDALGGKTLSELIRDGKITINVDPKYPQALGIATILERAKMFGNFAWEIIHNRIDDSPFFTSDFPVGIEATRDLRVLNRIVALTPTLALRIWPDISLDRKKCDFSFSHFRHRVKIATRREIVALNTALVRCGETAVFFRDDRAWISRFVQRNAAFRIEPRSRQIPSGTGSILISIQEIVQRDA